MRTSHRLLMGGGTVAALLIGAVAPARANAAQAPTVIGAGHVDVADIEYTGGVLEIGVHDESVEPGVEREVSDVVFLVRKQARTEVPADPAFRFLGNPGDKVWILPEIQHEDLLWPGLSTEELDAGFFVDDSVTLTVQQVVGAGDVAIYTEDAVGAPDVLVDSGDGLPDVLPLATGGHLHANWAFEHAGVHLLKVRAKARLAATGATITSAPVVYRFVVQP